MAAAPGLGGVICHWAALLVGIIVTVGPMVVLTGVGRVDRECR